ncbi:MAG: TadE/TadG family type IV pilus assembly protein [Alphaproteobacteria bacterium]
MFRKLNASGAALVEFAMVAPVFFAIMFFVFEFGVIMFIQLNLQQGLDAGVRLGAVSPATVQSAILQQMQGFADPSLVTVTIQSYSSFAAMNSYNPNTFNPGTPGTGSEGDVVLYQAKYTYKAITPVVTSFLGSTVVLTAMTVSKNEVPV